MPNAPDPRTAVVIATRDRRDALLATLGRLRGLPERPEVTVVDNASSDGTPEAVAVAAPWARLIRLSWNAGAAARSVGARRAGAPYVAFADDDSWWAPGALARAADLLDAHPSLGLLSARVLVGPEGRLDPVSAAMAASPLPRPDGAPGPAVLGFLACGAVVRRGAFLAVGGFEPRLGVGGEEALLAIDLMAAGWWLSYADDVVAHHHPSSARDPAARGRRQLRNALWSAWLRRPGLGGALDAARGAPWVLSRRRVAGGAVERGLRLLERERPDRRPRAMGDSPQSKPAGLASRR